MTRTLGGVQLPLNFLLSNRTTKPLYHYSNKLPLALVEVAQDIGQEKPTGVIRELAKTANLPTFVALCTLAKQANPVNPAWHDIDGFRVKRVWPKPEPH